MSLRSKERKLSFDILSTVDDCSPSVHGDINHHLSICRSQSDPISENGVASVDDKPSRRKRKHRNSKKKKSGPAELTPMDVITENNHTPQENMSCHDDSSRNLESTYSSNYSVAQTVVFCEEIRLPEDTVGSVSQVSLGELRQRSVIGGGSAAGAASVDSSTGASRSQIGENGREEVNSTLKQSNESNCKLETAESLDWSRLMAEDPDYPLLIKKSPFKYLLEEMDRGNSLRCTTSSGNDKERERVYDTIFRLPWRCELLIDVGFYVCLNSFLSLLTIMPIRTLMSMWRLLHERQFKKPSTAELSDFGCLIVMVCGVVLLGRADISLIYHMIRGQGTIKLYVVYNVLEIFDKLWQSFGGDVLETLFNSADGLVKCPPELFQYWLQRYIMDLVLATASSIVHSFILLAQAITLSTCIVAHNNALMALLVSNNFSEIKSNVFKRFSKDNVHSIVYSDSVERFHISAFLLFVLAQNILEAEGPWFGNFLSNALVVYICEMAIDVIKHSFIAKFNNIKPIVYSEFLEDLCKQTLNIQNDDGKKNLTFVPLAPACVVIRVLTPVYAARLPCGPFPWRFLWIIMLSVLTYVMLASLKLMIGMGLEKHATWYVKRCQKRKLHCD